MESIDIIKELTETAARARSNTKRIDALETRQNDLEQLTKAVAVVQIKQGQIETDVSEIKTDVRALRERPGKWWDALIGAILGLAAGYALKALLGV